MAQAELRDCVLRPGCGPTTRRLDSAGRGRGRASGNFVEQARLVSSGSESAKLGAARRKSSSALSPPP